MSDETNGETITWERIPTQSFGYLFTHIPEFVRDSVESLEREGVLYSDHWVDELDDFRHVRINFTPEEASEYVRRAWAYELWIRAGHPEWSRDVDGIDKDVADDADTYSPQLKDGTIIPPPYLCFAAFLGPHLVGISCGAVKERRTIVELQGKESALFTLERAIRALTPTIRSFGNREKGLRPGQFTRRMTFAICFMSC